MPIAGERALTPAELTARIATLRASFAEAQAQPRTPATDHRVATMQDELWRLENLLQAARALHTTDNEEQPTC
jgi:uncharacterized small protein (DUF1192 family)